MAVSVLGSTIKDGRERLGLSQEELAGGVCSAPTISRLENGDRLPIAESGEQLLERIGHSTMTSDLLDSKERIMMHEEKIRIRQDILDLNYASARKRCDALEALQGKLGKWDKQFLLLYNVILDRDTLSPEKELALLEEALLMTCPLYKQKGLPRLMSYDEIQILNNIAICYGRMGDHERAIEILEAIQNFYEQYVIYTEEALRTQPMVLYNLSKHLGQAGRYDECIAVCDKGIRIARKTGRCSCVCQTLYNRAWAMLRRNAEGDQMLAELSLRQAYGFAFGLDNDRLKNIIIKFYEDNFGKPISI